MNFTKKRVILIGLLVWLILNALYTLYSIVGKDMMEEVASKISGKSIRIRKKQTLFQVALYPVKIAPLVANKDVRIYTDFDLFTFQPTGHEVKNPFDLSSNYVVIKQYNDSTELTTVTFDAFEGIQITDIVFKKENDFHVYKYNFSDKDFPVNVIYCYINSNNMFYLGFDDIPVYEHDSLVSTPKKMLDVLEPAKTLAHLSILTKKNDSEYVYNDYYIYTGNKIYEKEIIDLLKKV